MLGDAAPERILRASDALHYLPCADAPVEAFFMLFLSRDLRYLGIDMNLGSATRCNTRYTGFYAARSRELGASRLICAHTHPFGSAAPSGVDVEMYPSLVALMRRYGLVLLDSIIIGTNRCSLNWCSLRAMRNRR